MSRYRERRRIYTSPLSRERSSADILYPDEAGVVDPRLVEAGGRRVGVDHATVSRPWSEAFRDGRIDPRVVPPSGESMKAVQDRVVDSLLAGGRRRRAPAYVVTYNGWIRTGRFASRHPRQESRYIVVRHCARANLDDVRE